MLQRSRGQIPAVDLRMANGRGYIRGVCGIDDPRGETFIRAAAHLKALAESQGECSWTIEIDIDFGPTTTLLRFLDLIDTLDRIARNPKLRATINVAWKVSAKDLSLSSTARNAKAQVEKPDKMGLNLSIEVT